MAITSAIAAPTVDDIRLQNELLRAAFKAANKRSGELIKANFQLKVHLDAAESEKTRLTAALASWRGRYERSWRAVAIISAYAGIATLALIWMVAK